jgi:7-keto-8-aminopelargonate synthetase-like enzyme
MALAPAARIAGNSHAVVELEAEIADLHKKLAKAIAQ